MENSGIGVLLGSLPFIIAICAFGLYILEKSVAKKIFSEWNEIRAFLRKHQKQFDQFVSLSQHYSPADPEPFGELAGLFQNHLVSYENLIDEFYRDYSEIHRKGNTLKAVPFWKIWYFPKWLNLKNETDEFWNKLDQLQLNNEEAIRLREKIFNLGKELAKTARDLMGKLQDSLHIYRELDAKLTGQTYIAQGRTLIEWENTLKTQIPLSFFSKADESDIVNEKESITQVHRVLKPAIQEINTIHERLRNWQEEWAFFSSAIMEIGTRREKIQKIIIDLESRSVSPIQWGNSRKEFQYLVQMDERFDRSSLSVEELRRKVHHIKHLLTKCKELEIACENVQANYLELLHLWSSFEIQRGIDWVKSAEKVLEQAKVFDETNWKDLVNLSEFGRQLEELKELQVLVEPNDPAKKIEEDELPGLVRSANTLFVYHQKLRLELEKISGRLKDLHRAQGELEEKLTKAKSVMVKTLPLVSSNPFLKRSAGNSLLKLQADLEKIDAQVEARQSDLIEKKLQILNEWMMKTEQNIQKLADLLSEEINEQVSRLDEKFIQLGNFNNIEDMIITEVRDILEEADRGERISQFSRPGDEPLVVIARILWAKNDQWQKIYSASRALEEIAGPILERFQKAEKNRQTALRRIEKGNEIIPEEPGWPPTTQNLYNERKTMQNLENAWNSLKSEHITAIQLVGKLSELSEQYQGLASRVQLVLDKAEQEQVKIDEYEKRLEEAKNLWTKVVQKYPEYRSLKGDTEKLFLEIDRDYEELKRRSAHGGLPFNQVLQNMRGLIRKLNDAVMPTAGNQVVDINGEFQKRIF